jgi:hypothetical protein
MKAIKNSFFVGLTLLGLMALTTSFNHKKAIFNNKKALAFTECTWYANTSTILSAVLDDDANQWNSQPNVTTSWSTAIYYVTSTVDITTYLGNSHPAGTITVYRDGVVVSTHTVAANQNTLFYDTFPYVFQAHYEVVW